MSLPSHKLATSFENGFKNHPTTKTTKSKPLLVAKMFPEFEVSLLWKLWLQFLSLSVHLPDGLDDWVLPGFWTLFWLCIFCFHSGNLNCHYLQVPRENWTPCSVRLDYNEIVASYAACSLWKDCDTWRIIYIYRSSLLWAVCQKSDLCALKPRKTSIQEAWIINYFLEVPRSAKDVSC